MYLIPILLVALLLSGCPSTPVEPKAVGAKPATIATRALKISAVTSDAAPPDYEGIYWSAFVTVGTPQVQTILEEDRRTAYQVAVDKIRDYLWKQGEELLITLKPRGDGMGAQPPTPVIHFFTGTPSQLPGLDPAAQRYLVQPQQQVPNYLDVQISLFRQKAASTNAISAFADAAVVVVPLMTSAPPLSPAKRADIDQAAGVLDRKLADLFTATNTPPPVPRPFNPLPPPGASQWVSELHVYSGEVDDAPNRLITVRNVPIESLIGRRNMLSGIPDSPADIKDTMVSTINGTSTVLMPLDDALRISAPEIFIPTVANTADSLQDFCARAHQALRTRFGLAAYDRTAVIWAYLMDSKWNSRGGVRPAASAEDKCLAALAKAGTSPLARFKIPPNPQAETGDQRTEVWNASRPYREGTEVKKGGLIPLAILARDTRDATQPSPWTALLADVVKITAVGQSLTPGTGTVLVKGRSVGKTSEEAAALLDSLPLVWVSSKQDGSPCFRKADENTTRRAFVASGECMQLRAGDTSINLPTEFVIEPLVPGSTTPPKIIEIRLSSG